MKAHFKTITALLICTGVISTILKYPYYFGIAILSSFLAVVCLAIYKIVYDIVNADKD